MPLRERIKRRNFLLALGGLAGLVTLSGRNTPDTESQGPGNANTENSNDGKYHLTAHIKKYYRKARI